MLSNLCYHYNEKNIGGVKGKNARKKTNNAWFETQKITVFDGIVAVYVASSLSVAIKTLAPSHASNAATMASLLYALSSRAPDGQTLTHFWQSLQCACLLGRSGYSSEWLGRFSFVS